MISAMKRERNKWADTTGAKNYGRRLQECQHSVSEKSRLFLRLSMSKDLLDKFNV
jgi:hypothetical protein